MYRNLALSWGEMDDGTQGIKQMGLDLSQYNERGYAL